MAEKKVSKKVVKKVAKKAVKKTAAKKAGKVVTKSAGAKSPAGGKGASTRIRAKVDVSYGNTLYIRGEGAGLSWTEGVPMKNAGSDEWVFETGQAENGIVFKFLINDEIWSLGEDLTVAGGGVSVSAPRFG